MKTLYAIFALVLLTGCGDAALGTGSGQILPTPCPTGDVCTMDDAGPTQADSQSSVSDAGADSGPTIDPVAHQACVDRACDESNCGDPGVLCDGEAVTCGTCTGDNLCAGNTADEGTGKAGKCNDDCDSTSAIVHGGCGTTIGAPAIWGVVATCTHTPYKVDADGGIELRALGTGGSEFTNTSAGVNYNCWSN